MVEKKLKSISKKLRIESGAWEYNEVQEQLYEKYAVNQPFHITPSLHALMLQGNEPNVFDTRQICIYDGDNLVAVGLYDVGINAAAGITNFYDPAYKKMSPGKHLIYAKLYECMKLGLAYFYPGYIVAGNDRFNYKITMVPNGREYYDIHTRSWLPFDTGMAIPNYLNYMQQALQKVQTMLHDMGRMSYLINYLQFDLVPHKTSAGSGIYLPYILYEPVETGDAQLGIVIMYQPDIGYWQVKVVAPLSDFAWKIEADNLIYLNEITVLYQGASFRETAGLGVYLHHLYASFNTL